MSSIGLVTDLKRFAVHDGDGIRTTVFLKGCPLKCLWCHNPEGLSHKPQLAYYAHKCIGCGECVKVCQCHSVQDGVHRYNPESCIHCGKCEEACLGNALKIQGKQTTVEELLPRLLEDRDFYANSGGGVTLSGGECLMQPEFCRDLLKALKREGIHTAVDTCGFVNRNALDLVMPYTDVFLYDVKAYDEEVHIACTGQSNKLILENLRYLNEQGQQIEIRIPFVPGYNDHQIEKIGAFLANLKHITKVRVLPYHNFAGSKYDSLGLENTLPETLPTKEQADAAREILRNFGLTVVE